MSLTIRKEVTAVKIFRQYILAGIGSHINIFDKDTGHLLQRFSVLHSENVYGIVLSKCERKVLVFGKLQFMVLDIAEVDRDIVKLSVAPKSLNDWIQSAVWNDDNNISMLSCHNMLMQYNFITKKLSINKRLDYSLLYCSLLLPVSDELIILAGTVFSEVIIRRFGDSHDMHMLKGHRGVIFSISCDPRQGIIVTTSDDRSVRIWDMLNPENHPLDCIDFWRNINIQCKHEVYGHTARVMRNILINDLVISGGEDAAICYWKDGKLMKKVVAHQTAPIWSMDSDGQHVVTGGGDGAIIVHPITAASDYGDKKPLQIDGTTKLINFTARGNIVLLNTDNDFIYYNIQNESEIFHKLTHESTYKMMALSSCKQIIAVADMFGQLNVFIENCKDEASIRNVIDTKFDIGKISSIHFAGNRHLVFCAEEGEIIVMVASGTEIAEYAKFVLPPCKERWLTACAIDSEYDITYVADRCSGVHCFKRGHKDPIKSFNKVHGRYGSTSLTVRQNELVSTGRDGTIKYFAIDRKNLINSKYMTSRELDFNWVEKFLDKNESLICGFHDNTFVVYSLRSSSRIIQTVCGGGHRAYDAIRCFKKVDGNLEECIQLIYVKSPAVYLVNFRLSLIVPKTIVSGSQSKGINSMKVFKNNNIWIYVSGGEDTTLRVSTMDDKFVFEDQFIYKHLSNIRTVKIVPYDNKFLILSAGGRAQICANSISFKWPDNKVKVVPEQLASLMLKGSDVERKNNKNWREHEVDFDPETRMMDVDVIRDENNRFFVFVGCSDGVLRVLTLNTETKEFKSLKEVKNCETCILIVACIEIANTHVVVTCRTTGQVEFWKIIKDETSFQVNLLLEMKSHKAGVNCIDYKMIKDNLLLIATGGDDNQIVLTLLEIHSDQDNLLTRKAIWNTSNYHSSQITGISLTCDDILLSTSIDQRVTVLQWKVVDDGGLECKYLHQICSDVADIQGMEVLEWKRGCEDESTLTVCVYGKGFELINIDSPLRK